MTKFLRAFLFCLLLAASGPAAEAARSQPELVAPESDAAWRVTAKERSRISLGLFAAEQAAILGVLAWLALSGTSARAAARLESRLRRRWLTVPAFVTGFLLFMQCVSFPFDLARYLAGRAYEVVHQPVLAWLGDYAVATAVNLPVLAAIGTGFFWIVSIKPHTWWRWVAAVSIPFTLAGMLVAPLYFSLFNTFSPIEDRDLAAKILSLASRCDIPAGEVYEIDMSKQTRAANAFVAGIGPTTTIALGDTLLDGFSDDEVMFVMAHEMGHYVHKHIWIGLGAAFVLTACGALLLQYACMWLLARVGPRSGIERLSQVSAAPLVLMAVTVLSAAGMPAGNSISRAMEIDADRFALGLTVPSDVSPEAAVSTFERLGRLALSDPNPNSVIRFVLWSHPTLDERIRAVREWPGNGQATEPRS